MSEDDIEPFEETPMPKTPPIDSGDQEFPVPAAVFIASLIDTPDEVWSKWVQIQHGRENHLIKEWHTLLDGYRNQAAY